MEKTETASGFVGLIGVVLGTIALGVALLHLWAGPLKPQPTLEEVVAEKAVKIRDSVVATLKGAAQSQPLQDRSFDADRVVTIATVVAGFLAIVLAVVSYIRREDPRVCASAAVLGGGALAVQYLALAIGAIVLAVLIAAVIAKLDFGIG